MRCYFVLYICFWHYAAVISRSTNIRCEFRCFATLYLKYAFDLMQMRWVQVQLSLLIRYFGTFYLICFWHYADVMSSFSKLPPLPDCFDWVITQFLHNFFGADIYPCTFFSSWETSSIRCWLLLNLITGLGGKSAVNSIWKERVVCLRERGWIRNARLPWLGLIKQVISNLSTISWLVSIGFPSIFLRKTFSTIFATGRRILKSNFGVLKSGLKPFLWIWQINWWRFSQMTDFLAGRLAFQNANIFLWICKYVSVYLQIYFCGFANKYLRIWKCILWICEINLQRFSQMTDSLAGRLAFQNANIFTKHHLPFKMHIKCQMHEG